MNVLKNAEKSMNDEYYDFNFGNNKKHSFRVTKPNALSPKFFIKF